MGMAASQARYLALVARKSNCEYQGQQINQARLNLSNQSANLFNQMLGLSVPVPPSTNDYTTKQYSFTDGVSTYTIDKWNQLAEADSDGYNYVVTYHYNSNVYTGYQKQKSDPQVQFTIPGVYPDRTSYSTQIASIQAALKNITSCQETYDEKLAAYKTLVSKAAQLTTYADNETSTNVTECTYDESTESYTVKNTQKDANGYLIYNYEDSTGSSVNRFYKDGKYYIRTYDATAGYTYTEDEDIDKTKLTPESYTKTYSKYNSSTMPEVKTAIDALIDAGALDDDFDINTVFYDEDNKTIAFGTDLASCESGTKSILPLYYYDSTTGKPSDVTTILSMKNQITSAQGEMDAAKSLLDVAEATYDAMNVPSYVGNCKLTALSTLTDTQVAEIKQIIADMDEEEVGTNIKKCFNTLDETYDANTYSGGIYTFELNGVTYITTYYDLADSINGGDGINNIDDQPKLPYYGADYISKAINKTEKALLETDSEGRFTSVRFADDSIKYTLNVETITDDVAYQDAMNQYYYESAQYDKMVQDINAKTSLIQQEDQQLELQLKQLETEQNALSTEIDAVQKVVKDNVEKSFKTFGG